MRVKRLILLTFLFVTFQSGKAQEFNDDARLWLYIKLDKDFSEKWNLHLVLQNRFNNNISEYSQGYSDIGMTYKINKHLRMVADYVYGGQRRLDGSYTRIHQAYTGLIYKQKYRRFQFTYRLLLQGQVNNVYSSEKGGLPKFYERSKLTVRYEFNKRISCFVAEELNSPLYRFNEIYFNRSRSFVGLNYELNKKSGIELYFMLQKQLKYTNQPNRDFVYGITYSYSF